MEGERRCERCVGYWGGKGWRGVAAGVARGDGRAGILSTVVATFCSTRNRNLEPYLYGKLTKNLV